MGILPTGGAPGSTAKNDTHQVAGRLQSHLASGDLHAIAGDLTRIALAIERPHGYRPSREEINDVMLVLPGIVTLAEEQGQGWFLEIILSFLHAIGIAALTGENTRAAVNDLVARTRAKLADLSKLDSTLTKPSAQITTAEPNEAALQALLPPVDAARDPVLATVQYNGVAAVAKLGNSVTPVVVVAFQNAGRSLRLKTASGTVFSTPASNVRFVAGAEAPHPRLREDAKSGDRVDFSAFLSSAPDAFPKMDTGPWEAEGPTNFSYNCIAHSVHDDKEWVWPGNTIADFDRFYGKLGYLPLHAGLTSDDFALSRVIEKVILFANVSADGTAVPTHAIYQTEDGAWSSKNGAEAQVKVASPYQLAGGSYGIPYKVYFRLRPGVAARADLLFGLPEGSQNVSTLSH